MPVLKVISPVDGRVYVECEQHGPQEIDQVLDRAKKITKRVEDSSG